MKLKLLSKTHFIDNIFALENGKSSKKKNKK